MNFLDWKQAWKEREQITTDGYEEEWLSILGPHNKKVMIDWLLDHGYSTLAEWWRQDMERNPLSIDTSGE